eukprot:Nk52_evm71s554 gene=Nk52_evmTU71s554
MQIYAYSNGKTIKPKSEREEYLKMLHRMGHGSTARLCQRFELQQTGFHLLNPIESVTPMHMVAYDLAGRFKVCSEGKYWYVLVVVDVATRYVWFRPVEECDSPEVANELCKVFTEFIP